GRSPTSAIASPARAISTSREGGAPSPASISSPPTTASPSRISWPTTASTTRPTVRTTVTAPTTTPPRTPPPRGPLPLPAPSPPPQRPPLAAGRARAGPTPPSKHQRACPAQGTLRPPLPPPPAGHAPPPLPPPAHPAASQQSCLPSAAVLPGAAHPRLR